MAESAVTQLAESAVANSTCDRVLVVIGRTLSLVEHHMLIKVREVVGHGVVKGKESRECTVSTLCTSNKVGILIFFGTSNRLFIGKKCLMIIKCFHYIFNIYNYNENNLISGFSQR